MFDNISEQFQFGKFSEQLSSAQKPVGELVAINAKALERLTQQQADLLSGLLDQGVTYVEGVGAVDGISSVVELQKAYVEGLREQLAGSAKNVYAIFAETQEKTGEVFKEAFAARKPATKSTNATSERKPAKPRAKSASAK